MKETVERAAWLGDVLLLTRADADDQTPPVYAFADGRSIEVATYSLSLAPDAGGEPHRVLLVNRFGRPVEIPSSLELRIEAGDKSASFGPGELSSLMTNPATFLCEELEPLDPERRTEALHILWTASTASLDRRDCFRIARLLSNVHREIRPVLPEIVMKPEHPNVAHIDRAFQLDPRSIWVEGWMHDRDETAVRLTLVTPEGGRAELLSRLFWFPRPDIEEYFGDKQGEGEDRHGFIGYAELDGPSYVSSGWLLELETGEWAGQKEIPDVSRNRIEARDRILFSLFRERPGSDELMRQQVHPGIAAIQEELKDTAAIGSVVQMGKPPASPSVSVIVPLYKQLSYLENQMAHWAKDPQMAHEDLIYVLDSPEQAQELNRQARRLHSLYGIPFRLAVMRSNAGFAGVNNCAVGLARADKLLLLNSDVVPLAPGWLAQMAAFYDSTPGIGALGPKLLFEDESLQHAGAYFHRSPRAAVWENMHYYKGQHRSLAAANAARPVPAVTGACLMIERSLYEEVGGLSPQYVQGGYEDCDLCLCLIEEERENWYIPDAELYHLEGQSYPTDLRNRVTGYNRWLLTELWGDLIQQVMEKHPDPEG